MSVSAPVRCEPAPPARFQVAVIPFPASPAAPTQHILSVEFGSPDGRSW